MTAFARALRTSDKPRGGSEDKGIMSVTIENLDSFLADGHVNPVHPGILFKSLVIDGLGSKATKFTVSGLAEKSGISREMLHRILRGDGAFTAKTAVGLAEASGTDAEFWMRAQTIFDLWSERQRRHGAPSPNP